jgi:hypothetical protein
MQLISQSRVLVEFEGVMIEIQQIQHRRAAGIMTIGFCNIQTKESNMVFKSYSKPGMNATAVNNTVCFVIYCLKYCEMYFEIKVIYQ